MEDNFKGAVAFYAYKTASQQITLCSLSYTYVF